MPSAANAKSEKPASSEDKDTPIRQIMTIIEHKIRNLEKRKVSKYNVNDINKMFNVPVLVECSIVLKTCLNFVF